jgi:hypothetical protein
MLTTLTPQIAVLLRGALYTQLQHACADAPATSPESRTREGWTPVMRRIKGAVAGLDVIGWDEPERQEPVAITLAPRMIETLEADADRWSWLSEQVRTESVPGRERAAQHAATIERFLAGLPERPAPLVIPTAAIPLVRECAYEGIPAVTEAIDRTGLDLREGIRRLTAISDLLDAMTEPTGDVDATEYANAVAEVAPPVLENLKTAVRELDGGDPERLEAEDELCLLIPLHALSAWP